MTSIIGHRSCPLRTSDSDCYVDIMFIVFQVSRVHCIHSVPVSCSIGQNSSRVVEIRVVSRFRHIISRNRPFCEM